MAITIHKHDEKTLEEIKKQQHPFEDDLLERKEIANHFAQIIQNTKSPFVFNINSPYGTGKTFFLTRLKVLLEQEQCTTVLYNSWETDWVDDPFIAILEEISEEVKHIIESEASLINKAAQNAWKNVYPAFISLGKELAKECIPGAKVIVNATDIAISNKNKKDTSISIEQYLKIKKAKKDLKNVLTKFTQQLEKPLVIIIDELDRCRPDYAVRTLEAIKHFFNIPNVVFILAIDREQIESAISVLYGKKIENNATEYLRKFIDYDFYLPYPEAQKFLSMLLNLHIKETIIPFCRQKANWTYPITSAMKHIIQGENLEDQVLLHMSAILKSLSKFLNFSLRTQEQIVLKMKVLISSLSVDNDILLPELLIWNVCLYTFNRKLYNEFKIIKSAQHIISGIENSPSFQNKNLDFSSIKDLLKSARNHNPTLSHSLTTWIDALLDYNKKLNEDNSFNSFDSQSRNSAQKYLELTPLL